MGISGGHGFLVSVAFFAKNEDLLAGAPPEESLLNLDCGNLKSYRMAYFGG